MNWESLKKDMFSFLPFALLALLGYWSGQMAGEQSMKREAVQAGAAEYQLDNDGKAVFKWKCKKERSGER